MLADLSLFHGYLTITEALWTFLGVVGVATNLSNIRDTARDLDVLEFLQMNGYMKSIATSHSRTNWLRMIAAIIVTGMGILAMCTPPSNPKQPVNIVGVYYTFSLFVIVVANTINSILDRRLRRNLMKLPHDGIDDSSIGEVTHA